MPLLSFLDTGLAHVARIYRHVTTEYGTSSSYIANNTAVDNLAIQGPLRSRYQKGLGRSDVILIHGFHQVYISLHVLCICHRYM